MHACVCGLGGTHWGGGHSLLLCLLQFPAGAPRGQPSSSAPFSRSQGSEPVLALATGQWSCGSVLGIGVPSTGLVPSRSLFLLYCIFFFGHLILSLIREMDLHPSGPDLSLGDWAEPVLEPLQLWHCPSWQALHPTPSNPEWDCTSVRPPCVS